MSNYVIRPAPAERKLLYYSAAGLYEAWSVFNALAVPADGDDMTGLMPMGSFLYILERQHIYRLTTQTDPAVDGYLFRAATRGCVNNRCWVLVDDIAYILDQAGAFQFTGGQAKPISEAIQDLFETYPSPDDTERINWRAAPYFHAVHYPAQEIIRWFVALSGSSKPRHALSYAYRTNRWAIEEWPFDVGCSALGRMADRPQVFLGGPSDRILAFGQGSLDGPDPTTGTVRGLVTAAGLTWLADSQANFPVSGVVGYPVVLASGRGKGQVRRVVAQTGTTLAVDQPWAILPDATTTYQLGGIPWVWRSGWFRWAEEERENPRRVEIVFLPLAHACALDARLYLDRASIPLLWDSTFTSEQANQFASLQGSPDLTADLTKAAGFVQRRMDSWREFNVEGRRFFQLELAGVANQDPVVIYQAIVDGAAGGGGLDMGGG
jgi:hypothetical protein